MNFRLPLRAGISVAVMVANLVIVGTAVAGDPEAGRIVAQAVCTTCHIVSLDQKIWPIYRLDLPTFEEIAGTKDLTESQIVAVLKGDHAAWPNSRNMPNVGLTNTQTQDVSSFILSLRPRKR